MDEGVEGVDLQVMAMAVAMAVAVVMVMGCLAWDGLQRRRQTIDGEEPEQEQESERDVLVV